MAIITSLDINEWERRRLGQRRPGSLTGAAWAEWVGWLLEKAGARVILQAWDFVPGSNFVLEMQRAAASAGRTIAILSPDYLKSRFAAPEWRRRLRKTRRG